MKLEKPVRQQLSKDRPCNGCGRTEGDVMNVEDWLCGPCRQNRGVFLHFGGTEEDWWAHRKQYVKKRADKHTGAMSPDQDRILADFHKFLHILNRLRCTKQEMKNIIAIIERDRLGPIRRWIPDDLRTITNEEWKVFLKDRVQPDEQEPEGEGEEFQSAEAELDVNTAVTSRSHPAPEPDEPASVNVNKDDASRSQSEREAEEQNGLNKHEGSRSQPEPQPEEPGGVNVNIEQRSHSPKDPQFTKLKKRTANKKEASAVERQKAEAAILNVLGHHDLSRMEDSRRDPFLATMTYSKLLHILNEGVRESKWARGGRTSGASWHMTETGVNMNAERSSRSQQEIPKATTA